MKAISLAILASLAVQPFVLLLWAGLPFLFSDESLPLKEVALVAIWVIAFAAAHLLVLGLPLFLLLRWRNLANWLTISVSGLLSGSVPFAIFSWPLRNNFSNYSSGGSWYGQYRQFVIDGSPTIYGWLQYAQGTAMFALHGLAGALAFYWAWRAQLRPNNSFKPNPHQGGA